MFKPSVDWPDHANLNSTPLPVSFAATNVETITLRSDPGVEELMQNRSVLSEGREVCFKMIPTLNPSICPQKKVFAQHPPDFNPLRCFELPVDAPVESDLWHSLRSYLGTWPMKGCKAKSSNLMFFWWFAGNHRFWRVYLLEVFQTNSWQFCRFRLSVTTQQHGEALHAPWVEAQVFTALKGEPEIGKPST